MPQLVWRIFVLKLKICSHTLTHVHTYTHTHIHARTYMCLCVCISLNKSDKECLAYFFSSDVFNKIIYGLPSPVQMTDATSLRLGLKTDPFNQACNRTNLICKLVVENTNVMRSFHCIKKG